ncbi:MAG: hypothetical protein V3V99_12480 [candidate division Zixibacteria bacterium]
MLKRREFLQLSALLAAGAVVTLSSAGEILAINDELVITGSSRPILRFHGHARSGCSFRPELTDMWHGGGGQLPDMV